MNELDLVWFKLQSVFETSRNLRVTMPLFGKKSPSGGKGKDAPPGGSPGPSSEAKKTPTVEDKYILKDVLGT